MSIASSVTSTDSTATSAMDRNNSSSSQSNVSSTTLHCRPYQDPHGSISGNFPEVDPSFSRRSACARHGRRARTLLRTAFVDALERRFWTIVAQSREAAGLMRFPRYRSHFKLTRRYVRGQPVERIITVRRGEAGDGWLWPMSRYPHDRYRAWTFPSPAASLTMSVTYGSSRPARSVS